MKANQSVSLNRAIDTTSFEAGIYACSLQSMLSIGVVTLATELFEVSEVQDPLEIDLTVANGEKARCLLCEGNEVRFKAIAQWALKLVNYRFSPSGYYRWRRKPSKIISEDELLLYREAKRLFNQTRSGISYVKLCRALNKSGFVF